MQWLIGPAAIAGLIWVMAEMGHHFDTKEDDPKFRAIRERLGRWLTSQNDHGFAARVRHANELFFHWFDALFHGEGTLLEQGLWLGLIFSPVMLGLMRLSMLVAGEPVPESSRMLLFAMGLAFALSITVVGGRAIPQIAGALRRVVLGGALVGALGGVLGVALGGVLYGVLYGVLFGVLFGVLGVVLGVVLFGVLVGVLGAGFSQGLTSGLALASGYALGSVAVQLLKVRLPVHPLRSVALSLFSVCLLGLIMREATTSFYHLLLQDGLIVLSYVAFNMFGDAISLLETRWVLGFSRNRGLLALPGFLLLDIVLSAAIFLFLPLVLGELPSFVENILFRGSRPWLGIFFWSTFATSLLFYLFVGTVVFLIVPGHGLARVFHRTVGRMIIIESRPFSAIAWGMSLLLAAVAVIRWAGPLLYRLVAG